MANKRISSLDDITLVGGTSTPGLTASDIIPVTDVDDTTGSLQGTTKKVTVANLLANAPDNSTDVTLSGTPDYITISGQTITRNQIDLATDVTGLLPNASVDGLGTAATTASTDYATTAQGALADTAVQPTDGIETLSNVSISNPADGSILKYVSANSQYEEASLGTASTASTSDFATSAQGALADTAVQPADNISTLTNDSAFITGLSAGALSDFDFDDNPIFGFGASVNTPPITANAYTLTDADNGKVLALDNGATAMIVNVNTGLVSGFNCSFIQAGSGQVTFAGTATLNNRQSHTKINDQYGVASIVAYATDTYILAGDTAA